MTEANLQTEWAALLFKSLADAGVRDVVISPGSRSTPLVVAAVREQRLMRHAVIDERAAAFFALGQARITGRPSVLVCTSGTALAHYLPAMIEADITATPMLVLSGDRPPELYDCSSPQTIDQVKIFGEYARHFFDLVPEPSDGSLRSLRRVAAQAVLTASWPRGGGVHMNARARKPLEPVEAKHPDEIRLVERARAIGAEPITLALPPRGMPAAASIEAAASLLRTAQRGILVAGPATLTQRGAREALWALARASGFAVACEATSQLRFGPRPADVKMIDGFELMLRSKTFRASAPFDVVLQVGAPPTSGPWEQISPSLPRVVLAEHGWPDPHSNTRVMVHGDIALSSAALADALSTSPPRIDPAFHERLATINAVSWKETERVLASREGLVEASAVRVLIDKAPERSVLMIGNSLSVRLVDIYTRASSRDVDILSQRGASGIDGLVAGTAGAATSAGRPTALLIGDVSFLYDLSSLALAAEVRTPLVVFVVNNGGGRIFEQLPIVDVPGIEPAIVEHATTPHDTDFESAAKHYRVRYARPTSLAEVGAALDEAYAHAGCTLIEVKVEPSGAIALARTVSAAIETAVAPLVTGKHS
jgi:2-succinyl-5-enolpyruvyl-6-hydroxy-3-cyclohexene-1-carboxylate synthase